MRLAVLLQYCLPHRLLSRIVYWATRWRFEPWKNFLIRQITRRYGVDLNEASEANVNHYLHFNAFFTRSLKPGARSADRDLEAVLQPADGRISQIGAIQTGRIVQAKGQDYSVSELLADPNKAQTYAQGHFATIYLSPRDYHRVHMPWTGTLIETLHIPGRLFSVAPFTVNTVPRLFARNERLICHFETLSGPFVVALVGAMLVSSIETVWGGLEIPPYSNRLIRKDYRNRGITLQRFQELGRFNMGSTVILLFPAGRIVVEPTLMPGCAVKVGEKFASHYKTTLE